MVSAGSVALARRRSHWNSIAAMAAPATLGASQPGMPTASVPGSQASTEPAAPHSAPRPIATPHCAATGNATKVRLVAHSSSSHISTAGSALPAPNANSVSQLAQVLAANSRPAASTPCTNRSARSTTPTWQTSKPAAGSRCGAVLLGRPPNAVVPKPVERRSLGRVGVPWCRSAGRVDKVASIECGCSALSNARRSCL